MEKFTRRLVRRAATAVDSGWVMGFDAASLSSSGSIYLAPASGPGAPGFTTTGLSADSSGNLYVFGQSSFARTSLSTTGALVAGSSGNAFLKLSTENGITLADYSKTAGSNSGSLITANAGASGAATVLPDFTDDSGRVWHLALGAGSDGNIYALNRDSLGGAGLQSTPIIQAVEGAVSSSAIAPAIAYFGGTAYYTAAGNPLKAFTLSDARLSTAPASQSGNTPGASGAQISISANGASAGILWAIENGTGILHAYDAANLSQELYNSTQAANSRDASPSTVSAVSPTIAGGRVFIATKNGIVVFGQMK